MATAELLLHPVRLRVIEAFLGDRKLTTSGLRSELPDVPAASLYRHVARLVEGGVLTVVGERRVRGAVERTYILAGPRSVPPGELAAMDKGEHRQAFLGYVAALIADFDRYLDREEVDLMGDGVAYRMAGMWLDDAELGDLLRDFVRVIQPRLANAPGPGRKRRILRTVLIPGPSTVGS